MRALLVANSAATIEEWLCSANFVVETAEIGEDALDLARHYDFDIIILDLQLSGMDGYEVLLRMRHGGIRVPVLAISSVTGPEAQVRALGLGADDCVVRLVDRAELLARVQAVIRRSKGFAAPTVRVGPLQLDLGAREVAVNGRRLHLTGKEYSLLELLVMRKGTAISKDGFLNHLYGGMDEPEIKIIDVFICKLRRKLADAGCEEMIGTVWGRGYILREPMNERASLTGMADQLVA